MAYKRDCVFYCSLILAVNLSAVSTPGATLSAVATDYLLLCNKYITPEYISRASTDQVEVDRSSRSIIRYPILRLRIFLSVSFSLLLVCYAFRLNEYKKVPLFATQTL